MKFLVAIIAVLMAIVACEPIDPNQGPGGDKHTTGTNYGTSESNTSTIEYVNRKVQDFMKFMDDIVFPRLDYGKGKGTFLTSMCVFASESTSLQKIKNDFILS